MLKRPLTDEWLDLDAPALSIAVTTSLSAPGDIVVRLPASYHAARDEKGQPILLEWQTLLVVVEDSGRTHVALLDDVKLTREELELSGGGLSMQATDAPWSLPVRDYVQTDPIRIIRDVWDHLNSYANHVSLALTGDLSSKIKIGRAESSAHRQYRLRVESVEKEQTAGEAALKAAEDRLLAATKALFLACGMKTVGQVRYSTSGGRSDTKNIVWIDSDNNNQAHIYKWFPARNVLNPTTKKLQKKPAGDDWGTVSGVGAQSYGYVNAKNARDKARDALAKKREQLSPLRERLREEKDKDGEAEPYTVAWHKTHDLSAVVEDMCRAAPVEWVEWAKLDQSTMKLTQGIELGHPRLGTRLNTLDSPRFELGVNVHEHPRVRTNDVYTDVKVYGSGEGSKTLHEYRVLSAPGRVRRIRRIVDKDASTKDHARRLADAEAARLEKQQRLGVEQLLVIPHSYALPGTYGVGDDVLLTGELSDGTDVDLWVRITELTVTSDGQRDMRVEAV